MKVAEICGLIEDIECSAGPPPCPIVTPDFDLSLSQYGGRLTGTFQTYISTITQRDTDIYNALEKSRADSSTVKLGVRLSKESETAPEVLYLYFSFRVLTFTKMASVLWGLHP